MNDLKKLPSTELVSELNSIRSTERETVAEVIRYLEEIDTRQYYRDLGYSSLFTFCTECLGYSESSAQRRICSARAFRVDQRIYQLIKTGDVTITTVSLISRELIKGGNSELLTKIIGKSKSEVEEILFQSLEPTVPAKRKATVRKFVKKVKAHTQQDRIVTSLPLAEVTQTPVEEEAVEYSLTLKVDQEFIDLLAEVKELSGKAGFDDIQSLKRAMRDYVEHNSPVKKQERRVKRKVKQSKPTKSIPATVKDQVYIRDGGRCAYVSKNGTRCSCRTNLEYDHVTPRALGGDNSVENIRLLCKAHNLLAAEQVFGREYIKKFSSSIR